MKSWCVGIYGETCSGKSTLGKHLSLSMGCQYVSFGDLKRDEIAAGTALGCEIQEYLKTNRPLPAELGFTVVRRSIGGGLNLISGYPISQNEFETLSAFSPMRGILVLEMDERTLHRRFYSRAECPECHMPGVIGDLCPIHKISMIQRLDAIPEELIFRRRLYQQRILPFLTSKQVGFLPRLSLDVGSLDRDSIVIQAKRWINQLS